MFKNKIFLLSACAVLIIAGTLFYLHEQSFNKLPDIGLKQHSEGGYSLTVNGKDYVVKGVCYSPIPIGKDYLYNFWGDGDKIWKTDGKLMKDMGINTIRVYKPGKNEDEMKNVLHKLYKNYGIRTLLGHHLGFMDWPPANYAKASFRTKVMQEVIDMVETYKDEPSIIAWVLGNENNYSFDLNVRPWSSDEIDAVPDEKERNEMKARIYYSFVDEIAKKVKEIDPIRPVIMGVGEVRSLDIAGQVCKNIDILGVIAYRGPTFGNLFRQVKEKFDRPVVLIEWGTDRFNAYTQEEDEITQAEFIKLQWKDIEKNLGVNNPEGIALGGTIFEWTDEWWKANENIAHTWTVHDKSAQWSHSPYYYDYEAPGHLNMNEEWWGVVGLEARRTESGPDIRAPKKAYYVLKELWK